MTVGNHQSSDGLRDNRAPLDLIEEIVLLRAVTIEAKYTRNEPPLNMGEAFLLLPLRVVS